MVTYYLKETNTKLGVTKYRAVVTQHQGTVGDDFITQVAETLKMSKAEVVNILSGIIKACLTLIRRGRGFTIPGLCTFSFGSHGSFDDPNSPWNNTVQRLVLNIRADRALSAAAKEAPKNRIHGVQNGPVIDAVMDVTNNAANMASTTGVILIQRGGIARLFGKNSKLAGEDPTVAISFVDADGDRTKITALQRFDKRRTISSIACRGKPAGAIVSRNARKACSDSSQYIVIRPRFCFAQICFQF